MVGRIRKASAAIGRAVGPGMIALALTAGWLGLDTDAKWGPIRTGLLLAGGALLILPVAWRYIARHGELRIDPSPALAGLDNPYDPAQRSGIPVVGDLSHYGGNCYMYWWQAPAVLLGLWTLIGGSEVGGEIVGFAAICVVLLSSTLWLGHFRSRYIPELPD